MKDFLIVRLHRAITPRDIKIKRCDDRALRHILKHAALGVAVWDIGVLGVIVEPSLRGGQCVGGLFVGAKEVEGVGGFMDEDCQVAVNAVEHSDIAVQIVGVTITGCEWGQRSIGGH